MNPKKFFTLALLITALLFVLPAALAAIFDPFFFFHKHYADAGFDGTDRYQNAGLINSFLADPAQKIDTIIIGTSMSQNLPVAAFKNEHDVNALKMTLAGGRAKELAMLLRKAIATGRVKKVVWEVYHSYANENANDMHAESPLPLFLYNNDISDDWRYLFNNDVVEEASKIARGKTKKRKDLETLYSWEYPEQFKKFSSAENLEKLRGNIAKADLPITAAPPVGIRTQFPSLTQNLLPILKENPDIEFELFFPPVSYYAYAASGNEAFWEQMLMRKTLLEEVKNLKNVRVYGFDLVSNRSARIQNYMDPSHYTPAISADLAQSMAIGKHRLNAGQWKAYTASLIQRVNNFTRKF